MAGALQMLPNPSCHKYAQLPLALLTWVIGKVAGRDRRARPRSCPTALAAAATPGPLCACLCPHAACCLAAAAAHNVLACMSMLWLRWACAPEREPCALFVQEQFEEAVNTNIEDFDMGQEEAVKSAIEEFAPRYDLSCVVTSSTSSDLAK